MLKNNAQEKFIIVALLSICLRTLCFGESTLQMQLNADRLREEGKTLEALNLYNQALVNYQKEHDYKGILAVLTGRLISWQHLFNHEEDKVYAILARKEAEAMLAIAEEHGIHEKDYLIHFLFGKSNIFLKDFAAAEIEFTKAVDLYPDDNAEKGDWMAHLGEAIYRNGDKKRGVSVILQGIDQMRAHSDGVDSFIINVWMSGAYLRLAKILIIDENFDEAAPYLLKGAEIILSDPRLVIRKQQLDLLNKKISASR